MEIPIWLNALLEACVRAYHPALHYDTDGSIVENFLWRWDESPVPKPPRWEQFIEECEKRSVQDIFEILRRAVTEGDEFDRVFALFLLGGLATPKARDLLLSYLYSPHRKERWASAVSLGRFKEERVFNLLQVLLFEGFAASEIFENVEDLQKMQEIGYLYQRACEKMKQARKVICASSVAPQVRQEAKHLYQQGAEEVKQVCSQTYWEIIEHLRGIDYEWYMRQRTEIALALGTWGNPVVIPKLKEALQAEWRMEQDWPNYNGPDESGPEIWQEFQDHLVFALGQLGAWDALEELVLPEPNLLVARIYLVLGFLQISDPRIFYPSAISTLFCVSPRCWRNRAIREKVGMEASAFVDPMRVKPLLAEHFGLSPAEQEEYLAQFHEAHYERVKVRRLEPSYLPESGTFDPL